MDIFKKTSMYLFLHSSSLFLKEGNYVFKGMDKAGGSHFSIKSVGGSKSVQMGSAEMIERFQEG